MQNKKTTAILLAVLAAAFYAVNVPFSKPVSYTHLTLPTNSRV